MAARKMTRQWLSDWMDTLLVRGWTAKLNRERAIRLKAPDGKIHCHCPLTAIIKEETDKSFSITRYDEGMYLIDRGLTINHGFVSNAADNCPRLSDTERSIRKLILKQLKLEERAV